MASTAKRARPNEGFYRTIEEGIKLENQTSATRNNKPKPTVDKKMYEIEVRGNIVIYIYIIIINSVTEIFMFQFDLLIRF